MLRRIFNLQSLLVVAMLLAFAGSLQHVAWAFSTLEEGNIVVGYLSAIAVDAGLLCLALGIQHYKRANRSTAALWLGVLGFSAISTYANLLHGIQFRADINLTGWTKNLSLVGWLDYLRPILLSSVLPILVIYLAEVISGNFSYEREQEDVLDVSRKRTKQGRQERLDAMLTLYSRDGLSKLSDVAGRLGVSEGTAQTYLTELEEMGRVQRDDGRVEIIKQRT